MAARRSRLRLMAGELDCALDGRVHGRRLKIECPRLRAIEHRLDDRVYPPDFAPNTFEQFAFWVIRIAALNQNVNGALNHCKRVLDFMGQAGGQLPETRSVVTTIDFTFARHRLSCVADDHQISDDLSRLISYRRNPRTETLSGLFAADLFVCGVAGLAAHRAGAELRNGSGLIHAAEDFSAGSPDDLFQGRPDYGGEGAIGAHDARIERLHADAVLNRVEERLPR